MEGLRNKKSNRINILDYELIWKKYIECFIGRKEYAVLTTGLSDIASQALELNIFSHGNIFVLIFISFQFC